MTIRDMMVKEFGEDAFVSHKDGTRPLLALRTNKRILLVLDREVIGPFVNRSTDPSDTIRFRDLKGRELVRVPSRKFKSKEKLRGLEICRAYGIVDPAYEYNAVNKNELLNNPNSVLFGDVNTQGDAAGLPSKFIYGEGLSTDEVANIAQPLTHNALSEEGTMWDRQKGSYRTSLFETFSILPGAHLIQTITVDSPTPESLAHLLMCLTASKYGAQTSITGSNIRNRILGMIASREEPPVTAYTLVGEMAESGGTADLVGLVEKELSRYSGVMRIGSDAERIMRNVQTAKDLETTYRELAKQSSEFFEYVYDKTKRGKGRRAVDGE